MQACALHNKNSFVKLHKNLFISDEYQTLSLAARTLYSFMLDRLSLSKKNGWVDKDERAYIIFTMEEAMSCLGIGKNKCVKVFNELRLCGGGLIKTVRQGLGRPNLIYVHEIEADDIGEASSDSSEPGGVVYSGEVKRFQKQTSRSPENKLQEVSKTNSNNTNNNKTENNNTESIQSYQGIEEIKKDGMKPPLIRCDREQDKRKIYKQLICKNIEYTTLVSNARHKAEIDAIVNIMVDTVCSRKKSIRINSEDIPIEAVKSRFMSIRAEHIEYVLDSSHRYDEGIVNIRSYLISCLYNAPLTIAYYYG